ILQISRAGEMIFYQVWIERMVEIRRFRFEGEPLAGTVPRGTVPRRARFGRTGSSRWPAPSHVGSRNRCPARSHVGPRDLAAATGPPRTELDATTQRRPAPGATTPGAAQLRSALVGARTGSAFTPHDARALASASTCLSTPRGWARQAPPCPRSPPPQQGRRAGRNLPGPAARAAARGGKLLAWT